MNSWRRTAGASEKENLEMINSQWCVYGPRVGRVPRSVRSVHCVYLRRSFSSTLTAAAQNDCERVYSTPARLPSGHTSRRERPTPGHCVLGRCFHYDTSEKIKKRKQQHNNKKSGSVAKLRAAAFPVSCGSSHQLSLS